MSEEKKVWKVREVNVLKLDDELNELAADGYHVFNIIYDKPNCYVVAFNQVELAKNLATQQVLQAVQQAGEEALKSALSKENKG